MARRILIALGSFWLAGVVAIAVMSDPGALSDADVILGLPLLAAIGVLLGPCTFVAGVHGLIFGYRSGVPCPGYWIALAYAGYIGLFIGAVGFKSRELRIACLVVEAICAFVAAKGVSYCI